MKQPEIPADEQARLGALRSLNILDTPPEERFDRLTRVAKRMFGVPIALISLIDENRQWFKSCVGLDVKETPRDISFCGHAIHGDEIFIIPNATEDERFADNPLVIGDPHIRFYAGCPLKAPDGRLMGTLCIIDRASRDFASDDLDALRDLASMVEREMAAIDLATTDELTGISNRRGFMVLAQQSLHICSRQNIPASLVFMDLDKFKQINDSFGHAEGDLALIAFTGQMKNIFRNSDVFARFGGDEFVVLLTNTSKQQADAIIDKFGHALRSHNEAAKRGYNIEFSYGVVDFDSSKHDGINTLLAQGDALMYEVKKAMRQAPARA